MYKNISGHRIELTPEEVENFFDEQKCLINIKSEIAWSDLRLQRNQRLLQSDWAMLPDVPLTKAEKDEVAIYRQLLRDLPNNIENPFNVEWPIEPEFLTNQGLT